MLDVVEDDGLAIGGDAAGETGADRDANAALHLLLQADRGAGDELVLGLVEEEHDRCVRVDTSPRQELGEKLVEVEVAEARRLSPTGGAPAAAAPRARPRTRECSIEIVRVRDDFQQVDVFGREGARRKGAHVQHAQDPVCEETAAPSRLFTPFSRRIGLRTSPSLTSSRMTGRRSAATRPANPPPMGMRTPA